MSFWKTSDGKEVERNTEFDSGGGFEVIPEGTKLLALIDEAGWKSGFEGEPDLIQIRWTVLAPEGFKNRKVFQKIKVKQNEIRKLTGESEEDFKKRLESAIKTADRAKRMLAAIDANAGGKLAHIDREPEDNELMGALMNKSMIIRLGVWENNGKKGNWVSAVSSRNVKAETQA